MFQSRNPAILRTIPVIVALCLVNASVQAKYSGGSGTADDPYRIATAADLIALGNEPNDYGEHFVLTADIDLDPNLPGNRVFDRAVVAPDIDALANGFQGPAFTGVLDGQGHAVAGLVIDSNVPYAGLFGSIGVGGRVCSLRLARGSVRGQCLADARAGIIGGTGGLAAENRGLVAACGCEVIVNGACQVGGLVGYNDGAISACYSTGSVSATSGVGGLVGYNDAAISACYSTGSVSGTASYSKAGGIVGEDESGTISDCYSTGAIRGHDIVGGLVGQAGGKVTRSYSTGTVTGVSHVGGLVGVGGSLGGVSYCVWDTETSLLSGSPDGVGLTTAEMKDPRMLGLNGFANDPNWLLDAGRDYARLAWEGAVGSAVPEPNIDWLEGEGTPEAAYRIDSPAQLILLSKASILWDKHLVLTSDIDLSQGATVAPVFKQALIQTFTGVLDGKGHTISHLKVEGSGCLGLFGRVGPSAQVRDVEIADATVIGCDYFVGGLVADNSGELDQCHFSNYLKRLRRC